MYIHVCICVYVFASMYMCVCVRGGVDILLCSCTSYEGACPQALGIVCTSSKYMREESALGACRGPQRELDVQSLCKRAEGRVRAACVRSTM